MTLRPSAVEGPLSGTTVIDLTRVLAGPYCTMVLADMGARVIKVEAPPNGDDSRSFGPFMAGRSAYFMSLNRGKESIALDLKNAADQRNFERLLEHADVLVENFRPGVLERLGYGWDHLRESFPRLVYLALSGFGRTGPYAQRPAYDMVVQAMGGIMSLTGHPGGAPTRDPNAFYGPPPGALLPFGGHKGSGLCMMVDILAGALTSGGCAGSREAEGNNMLSVFIDAAQLRGNSEFGATVASAAAWVKSSAPISADGEVLVPGEIEARRRADRLKHGIVVDEETWRQIVATAKSVGLNERQIAPEGTPSPTFPANPGVG